MKCSFNQYEKNRGQRPKIIIKELIKEPWGGRNFHFFFVLTAESVLGAIKVRENKEGIKCSMGKKE